MDETSNLKLPYILAAQSQKHVTHNEALRALDAIVQLAVQDKDLSTPPGAPAEGARYIVAGSPTGAWVGHATHVAAWQDEAWAFHTPLAGWLAWVDDESQSYLFSGGGWIPAPGGGGASLIPKGAWSGGATYVTGDLVEHDGYAFLSNIDDNTGNEPDAATPASTSQWTYFSVITGGGGGGGSVNPVSLVGVNETADTTNRLAVSSPASLFSHEGAGHQLKINKDAAGDTASVLFQTGFSGRAEFGLAGDDDFHVKVSADGSTWHEALVVSRSTGAVRGRMACAAPGGRLTLTSNTPILTSDVSGAGTIYYTPYVGQHVPLYDGTRFVMTDILAELSQALSDTTKSPAAATTNSNYDLFVWSDSGTIRCTRGPAWSSLTSRGTGSGTTELERARGFLVNKQAITNGPAAQRGLYVGTVRTNASSTVDMIMTPAAGVAPTARIHVWNAFNQVPVVANIRESTDSWTYNSATYRRTRGASGNFISYVDGLAQSIVEAWAACPWFRVSTPICGAQLGLSRDWSSGAPNFQCVGYVMANIGTAVTLSVLGFWTPSLGGHQVDAVEAAFDTSTVTFYGDGWHAGGGQQTWFMALKVMA